MQKSLAGPIILCILCLIAGCSIPGNIPVPHLPAPSPANLTPSSAEIFPRPPVILPARYQSDLFMGSFDESYIGSSGCSSDSETFSTNYTLFTGSGGLHRVHYTLVPVDADSGPKGIPLSSDILNASITPDDFVALPGHIYTSRLVVTVGPNVTGASGRGWIREPNFQFALNVTVDGTDAAEADDVITVSKRCYEHPGINRQPGSALRQTPASDIVLKPGGKMKVPVSISNSGGGIREVVPEIPSGAEFKRLALFTQSGQQEAIPDGLQFTFEPPALIGRNFRDYSYQLGVSSDTGMSAANYSFPLVLCYRTLDLDTSGSAHYPFADTLQCNTGTGFNVDVI